MGGHCAAVLSCHRNIGETFGSVRFIFVSFTSNVESTYFLESYGFTFANTKLDFHFITLMPQMYKTDLFFIFYYYNRFFHLF